MEVQVIEETDQEIKEPKKTTAVDKVKKNLKAVDVSSQVTEKVITEYLDAFGLATELYDNEKKQFIQIATMMQLNPFKKEIYCVPYNTKQGRKLSIITGYEVYLKRAERSKQLDGWNVTVYGNPNDGSLKAVATIYRKDWKYPLIHECYFTEYNQSKGLWLTKPITMLKKVCIAQAFRMAFPDEFDGMPYIADELPPEMTDVTPGENIDNN